MIFEKAIGILPLPAPGDHHGFVSLIPVFFKPRFMISSVNRRSGTRQLLPAKAGKPHFLIRGVELLLGAVQFKDQLRALIL